MNLLNHWFIIFNTLRRLIIFVNLGYLKKQFTANKLILYAIIILVMYIATYPTIYHISDEAWWLDVGRQICQGNYSYYDASLLYDKTHDATLQRIHGPIYYLSLCLTSPLHNFNITLTEVTTFFYLLLMVAGWWYFARDLVGQDAVRRRFILLLLATNLLWIYTFRVLLDVPLAALLSLGLLCAFLFVEKRNKKYFYFGLLFLAAAMLTKVNAIIFFPVLFLYLFVRKKLKDVKNWLLLVLPLLPFLVYSAYRYSMGFDAFYMLRRGLGESGITLSFVPYAHLPIILYMVGVYGLGIVSCVWLWKNMRAKKFAGVKNFLVFSLVLYLMWEVMYDFVVAASVPRFHLTLIPFFAMMIAVSSVESKTLKWLFYLALLFTLVSGVVVMYSLHTQTTIFWRNLF